MAAARSSWLRRLRGGVLAMVLALPVAPGLLQAQQAPKPAPQPVIVEIGVTGCVAYGATLKLRGRNLGRPGDRLLVLRDRNRVVALPVSSWNTMSIRATVPIKKELEPGKWYVLGIQEARSGRWLSGQGRPLQICEEPRADRGAGTAAPTGGPVGPGTPGTAPSKPRSPGGASAEQQSGAPVLRPAAPQPPGQQPPGQPVPPTPGPAVDSDDTTRVADEVLAITASLADATGLAQQLTAQGYAVRALLDLPALGFALLRLGLPNGQDVPAALDALRQAFPTTLFDANTLYEPDRKQSGRAALRRDQLAAGPRHYAKDLIGWPQHGLECAAEARIGLIDTAVDRDHPALQGRRIVARSFIAGGVPPAPPDHGTAIAAILVGAPGSDSGGLLPAARLQAAAIFSLRDDGRIVGTTDAIARAIDWLGQEGVRVVNLSLSSPGNQVMRLTMERAHAGGMILVAAAGNEGPHAAPVFPAGYSPVLAVTAVDAALQPYQEANRGDYIDLAAPGVDVWSAQGGQGGRYNSGTSFAAPFVSAAAAFALAKQPDSAPDRVRQALRENARDLGAPGRDSTFGWGLLQPPGGC